MEPTASWVYFSSFKFKGDLAIALLKTMLKIKDFINIPVFSQSNFSKRDIELIHSPCVGRNISAASFFNNGCNNLPAVIVRPLNYWNSDLALYSVKFCTFIRELVEREKFNG